MVINLSMYLLICIIMLYTIDRPWPWLFEEHKNTHEHSGLWVWFQFTFMAESFQGSSICQCNGRSVKVPCSRLTVACLRCTSDSMTAWFWQFEVVHGFDAPFMSFHFCVSLLSSLDFPVPSFFAHTSKFCCFFIQTFCQASSN